MSVGGTLGNRVSGVANNGFKAIPFFIVTPHTQGNRGAVSEGDFSFGACSLHDRAGRMPPIIEDFIKPTFAPIGAEFFGLFN